jgi:16S rRNA processing protein RimM
LKTRDKSDQTSRTRRSSFQNRARRRREAQTPDSDEWVAIGLITGMFGIRGEVKVQLLTDFPERFLQTATVYAGDELVARRVLGARLHQRIVILRLEGVETANDAEALRNKKLYVPASELVALPPDHYYLHDLVGLRVVHVDGTELGIVRDVIQSAGNDLLVIRSARAGKDVLLPTVKEFVKAVDVAGGALSVDPIPGFFDEGADVAEDNEKGEDDA